MFDKVFLEITNACNLSCSFCPPTRRSAEFMSRVRFELFLRRLEGHARHLYFHVKGEPLLHPALGEFLDAAGERGFQVSLVTNGTLLADRADELLPKRNIRKLSVSLHSHSGSDRALEYWRGIEAFLERHRASPSFPVSLRLWNRRAELLPPESAGLWDLLRERYPSVGVWESAASAGDSRELDHRVFLNLADEYAWPSLSLPQIEERGFCRGLRNQIAVLVDGSVVPCCMDGDGAMTLGDLGESGLGEILAGPRARAIYDGFSARRLTEPLCRSCGYRRRFSRAQDFARQPGRGS
ncbi:MAG: radical SAM/SPASM domain-containing protein [Spirochaetaceae bacterium]|nr:radical SAM/SPASM domain-containing protein [Spirochaetaceae bacterium]